MFKADKSTIKILKDGGVGVLPTDTLYGLVGSALREKTVERIYKIKNRSAGNPFIILISKIKESSLAKIKEICQMGNKEQHEESTLILQNKLEEELVTEDSEFTKKDIISVIDKVMQEEVRDTILNKNTRIDSRLLTDIRPITCEIGVLPRTHGSGLFTRGQTQSLSITT